MKTVIIIFILVLLNINHVLPAKLTGDYESNQFPDFYVGLFQGGQYICIDSITLDNNGRFSIDLPNNRKGILLIVSKNGKSSDEALNKPDNTSSLLFVYDGQSITYKTSWRWHSQYLEIKEGGESTKTVEFLYGKRIESQSQLAEMERVMDNSSTSTSLQQALSVEYAKNIEQYNKIQSNLLQSVEKGSVLECSLLLLHQQEVPFDLRGEERIQWLRNHFFDDIDLNNPLVYDNPFFKERITQYLYIWKPKGLVSDSIIQENKDQGIVLLLDQVKDSPKNIQELMKKMIHSCCETG